MGCCFFLLNQEVLINFKQHQCVSCILQKRHFSNSETLFSPSVPPQKRGGGGVLAPGQTEPDLFWAYSLPDAARPHAWRFQLIMEFKVIYLDYFT